jgi:UDP-N-acetylmuramoylalanine--D-glutamate ligase
VARGDRTNGKTTTVEMLAAMLAAVPLRAEAAGNIGTPLLEAVLRDVPPDWLAVELSSFQLHWSESIRPRVAAILNVAPDHLDWHGSLAAYAADKARVWARMGEGDVAVGNADDPLVVALLAAAPAGRKVEFTLAPPMKVSSGSTPADWSTAPSATATSSRSRS